MSREHIAITSIEAAPLAGKSPKGGWAHETAPGDSVHTLIAVHTDSGLSGYGSVFSEGGLVKAALKVLEPIFAGENALEPERVSEKLHRNTFWMGRGGTLTHAISGIDIALWDVCGKALGQPAARLLGGVYRSRVKPYCSLLMDEPERMRDEVARFKAAGFRAFKIGWGPFGRKGAKHDEAIVRAVRIGIGEDADLFVDAGASDAFWPNDLKWAINTSHMLDEYGVGWFEEAIKPDLMEDFRELRRQSRVPVAGGEVLTRRQSFTPWLVRGALDIVQPDVTKVGGLSEQRRIAWMAEEFGVRYVGHGWNTALGIAADLQLAAALPQVDFVEFIGGSAYVDDIMTEPFRLDEDGYLPVPSQPGLGISLDPERVERYSPDSRCLFQQ